MGLCGAGGDGNGGSGSGSDRADSSKNARYYRCYHAANFAFALAALLFAYGALYLLDIVSCSLCTLQRSCYGALLVISAISWMLHRNYATRIPRVMWIVLVIAGLLCILGNLFIAIFHWGLEHGLWAYDSSCAVDFSKAKSIEEYDRMLSMADAVRCDMVFVRIAGISIAGWNVMYIIMYIMAQIYCFCVYRKGDKFY